MILHCDQLTKSYKKRTVVDSVNIKVDMGEIVGLLGPNGAGKTTTFYMFVGIIRPDSGKIFLGEQNLTRKPMFQRARSGIGYLSQEASVFRNLTVRENLETVLQFFSIPKTDIRERADNLIEEFNLTKVVNNYGYSLSGGERRRTEIARAMITQPKFILLDEPFAGVDPIAVEDIQQIVTLLKKKNIGSNAPDEEIEEDETLFAFESNFLPSGMTEREWNNIHK
jgi:lipopolysaccharide export system ATP-binding protein